MKYLAAATLGASAAAVVFALAAGTAAHPDPEIALTNATGTSGDFLGAMNDANTAVDDLARQQIVGQKFFEHQQTIQDNWTAGLTNLSGQQQDMPYPGATPIADDPSVQHANEALTSALTNLTTAENSVPVIPTDATVAENAQQPVLLFDEAKILGIDYFQVTPAALNDMASSIGAIFGELGSYLGETFDLPAL